MKLSLKPLEWGLYANEYALITSYAVIVGGLLGTCFPFPKWQLSIYSLFVGIIVFVLEYPRSYRSDLKFVERRYQKYFVPFVLHLGFLGKNFYARFVLYLGLSVPLLFLLPTFIGGVSMITASLFYLKAASCGYEWKVVSSNELTECRKEPLL
ncbi:cytochrome b-245 light chain-like [Uloborus diversus]|uniref:cytochrome b-245 light chain-like n=1 Tax=Uloborus diversus TaxID=327109 RepID=UPI00240A4EEB|nr:cytochrome b-245 light chain-like [Uloborus diversus]